MAVPTLYEALDAFQEQYKNALAENSQRLVAELQNYWQRINNDWALYLQAKAESNATGASEAIADIVEVLGGIVDTSLLPNIGGSIAQFNNVHSVVPGAQKISFIGSFPDTNYRLIINIYDSSGNQILYVRGSKEADGFNITPSFAGTLEYNAIYLG